MNRKYSSMLDIKSDMILALYDKGYGCPDIVQELQLTITPRSVQRYIKKHGQIRTRLEALKLAEPKKQESIVRRWQGYTRSSEWRKCISPVTRYKVLERDNFTCTKCGSKVTDGAILEVDHKTAVINGGANTIENLQTVCSRCNIGKFWTQDRNNIPIDNTSDK